MSTRLFSRLTRATGRVIGAVAVLTLAACGGGTSGSFPAAGTVTLAMTDAPSDAFESLRVTVTAVTLIGASGQASIPLAEGPVTVDLLDLDGINEVLATASVPVDTYNKIRLELSNAEVTWPDGSAEAVTIVADGKVDLNFQGGLAITDGSAVTIQLDFSAEESLKLQSTGSDKLILRPQIFVMAVGDPHDPDNPVVDDVAGVVAEVNAVDQTFALRVRSGVTLTVAVTDQTTIVSPDGPAAFADLHTGLVVHVEGTLDAEGRLVASVIHIVRERRAAYGLITQLDAAAGTLVLLHRDDTTTNVAFDADTTVLFRGRALSASDLVNGQLVRVGGDFDASGTLHADVIRIRPDRFAGVVTSIARCYTEDTLAVKIGSRRLLARLALAGIALPDDTITVQALHDLRCPLLIHEGSLVRVWGRLAPDAAEPGGVTFIAARIVVLPGHVFVGNVTRVTPDPGNPSTGSFWLSVGPDDGPLVNAQGFLVEGLIRVRVTEQTLFASGLAFGPDLEGRRVGVLGRFVRASTGLEYVAIYVRSAE